MRLKISGEQQSNTVMEVLFILRLCLSVLAFFLSFRYFYFKYSVFEICLNRCRIYGFRQGERRLEFAKASLLFCSNFLP